jgi:TRAP-type uncharacterized transport system substrate-binding protein
MTYYWKYIGTSIATAAITLMLAGGAVAEMPKTLSISTSGKGGSWFAVGSRVIREVEKQNPGLVTQVQTGGGLTNLRKIQAGQADIGMTFAFAAPMAYKAQAPFEKPHDKLTYLGVLFPGYLQIVTKKASNINKFEDLYDKRISAGKIGWGGELMFRLLLKTYGMDYDDLLKIDDAGLDRIFKAYPSLVETTMPADPYKGVKGGFRVIGGAVILVAKKSLSDDAAYRIVKAIYENLDGIKADMKQLREAQAKDALKGNKGLPLHPGAARYYKEKGLM